MVVCESCSPRVPFVDALPRPARVAWTTFDSLPGVGPLTLPPTMPTFVHDDGRFRFTAELFIVFRSAPGGDRPL
jgi:hypothetical protein